MEVHKTYENYCYKLGEAPYQLDIVRPTPVQVLVNETRDKRSEHGPSERADCVYSHWTEKFILKISDYGTDCLVRRNARSRCYCLIREQIADASSCNTQERGTYKSPKESENQENS